MQIFITDNRYAPGSSHSDLPYDALAAYSARWLDRGSGVPGAPVWRAYLPDGRTFDYAPTAWQANMRKDAPPLWWRVAV